MLRKMVTSRLAGVLGLLAVLGSFACAADDVVVPVAGDGGRGGGADGGTDGGSSSGGEGGGQVPGPVIPPPVHSLAQVELWRDDAWATLFGGGFWNLEWDGSRLPSDVLPNHLAFESNVDDDYEESSQAVFPDRPTPGFFTVKRATECSSLGHCGFTGNVWRREELFTDAEGLTIEVGVRVLPNSTTDAFHVFFEDDRTSVGVYLSPLRAIVSDVLPVTSPQNYFIWGTGGTSTDFVSASSHTYRIVKWPKQAFGEDPPANRRVSVYVDGAPTELFHGFTNGEYGTQFYGDKASPDFNPYLSYPRVLVGDNSNDPYINAEYELDFVRYRTGAFAPGTSMPYAKARTKPPLPASGALPAARVVLDGSSVPEVWPANPELLRWYVGSAALFTATDGVLEYDAHRAAAPTFHYARYFGGPSRTAAAYQPDRTFEAKLQVMPDSQADAFSFYLQDAHGSWALTFSTDGISLRGDLPAVGVKRVAMTTTDRMHTYRVVRKGLYLYLHVDGAAAPVVWDLRQGGQVPDDLYLDFGSIAGADLQPLHAGYSDRRGHVRIEDVRLYDGAFAP